MKKCKSTCLVKNYIVIFERKYFGISSKSVKLTGLYHRSITAHEKLKWFHILFSSFFPPIKKIIAYCIIKKCTTVDLVKNKTNDVNVIFPAEPFFNLVVAWYYSGLKLEKWCKKMWLKSEFFGTALFETFPKTLILYFESTPISKIPLNFLNLEHCAWRRQSE